MREIVVVKAFPPTCRAFVELARAEHLMTSSGRLAFEAPIGWSIPSLIAPKGTVGTVGSIMDVFSNLTGIGVPIVAGLIFTLAGSFAANFLIAGIILVPGIFSSLFLPGHIEQISVSNPVSEMKATSCFDNV